MKLFAWVAERPQLIFAVLTAVNLMNYMDRGIIPGATNEFDLFILQNISTTKPDVYLGILQSSFIVGFAIASLVFGHLVHYYGPFFLCGIGMSIWILAVCLSGVSYYANSYIFLVFARALSGVGEASFQCSIPPWISNQAPDGKKGTWLAIFYTAIPVGTALGYAYSALIAEWLGWQWSFFIEAFAMAPFVFFLYSISPYYPCKDVDHLAFERHGGAYLPVTEGAEDDDWCDVQAEEGGGYVTADPAKRPQHSSSSSSSRGSYAASRDDAREDFSEDSTVIFSPLLPQSHSQHAASLPLPHNYNASATRQSTSSSAPPSVLEELKAIFQNPIYSLVTAGYAAQVGSVIGVSTFGSAFLMGLGFFNSESESSTIFGALVSIAGIIGTPIGGLILDYQAKQHAKAHSLEHDNDLINLRSSSKTTNLSSDQYSTNRQLDKDKRHTAAHMPLPVQSTDNSTVIEDEHNEQALRDMTTMYSALQVITLASAVGVALLCVVYLIHDRTWYLLCVTVGCGFVFLCNSGINLSIMLSVPQCHRSFGIAMMSVMIHAFGDVPSPIIAGLLKNMLAPGCSGGGEGETAEGGSIATSASCRADEQGLRLTMLIVSLWLGLTVLFFGLAWLLAGRQLAALRQVATEHRRSGRGASKTSFMSVSFDRPCSSAGGVLHSRENDQDEEAAAEDTAPLLSSRALKLTPTASSPAMILSSATTTSPTSLSSLVHNSQHHENSAGGGDAGDAAKYVSFTEQRRIAKSTSSSPLIKERSPQFAASAPAGVGAATASVHTDEDIVVL